MKNTSVAWAFLAPAILFAANASAQTAAPKSLPSYCGRPAKELTVEQMASCLDDPHPAPQKSTPPERKPWDKWADYYGFHGHKWESLEADNGATFGLDVSSIVKLHRTDTAQQEPVIAVMVFDPFEMQLPLRQYLFDCSGHFMDDTSGQGRAWQLAPPRSMAGALSGIACKAAPK